MVSPQSKDKIKANKRGVMNNATRENKKNIILNEPSHLKFSTA